MCVQASLTFTGNVIMLTCVVPMSARQVAGRLQVEVWHGTEISEADGASQPASQPSVAEEDQQERRLDCVVRIILWRFLRDKQVFWSFRSSSRSVLEQVFRLLVLCCLSILFFI